MQRPPPLSLPPDLNQCDVTGTVDLARPQAVADAVCAILGQRYAEFDEAVVRQAFADIEDIFWGRFPGLLQCDTPYHDLRHSLGTALLMTRMVDGYETVHGGSDAALGCGEACLAVLLALFHDIGFLRRTHEGHLHGACLVREHEARGVDFMRGYLARGPLACFAAQADLINVTNFALATADTLKGRPHKFYVIGQMLGTADLVSQVSGRYYLERCRNYLFREFVIAGVDKTVAPNGETVVLYATPEDLLRKTPGFYEFLVKRRIEEDFARVNEYVKEHFGGDDPYARAMQRNLDHLRELIRIDDFSSLRRKPVPLMPMPPAG